MFVAPVPQDTPIEDLSANPPPGTGPYMITKSQPGKGWEYERNPYWAKANAKAMPDYPTGNVDSAKITVIRNPQTQVNDIEQGNYDWMQNPPPSARYAEVKEKYEGTQFRVEPTISTYYFWMNTDRSRRSTTSKSARRSTTRSTRRRWNGSTPARSTAPSRSCRRGCRATKNSSSTRTTWPKPKN